MRGYGDVHPTIAELRVGYVPICYQHPSSKKWIEAGEVLITECEVVASHELDPESGQAFFTLGYGVCMGHNEAKAISMAILDRSLQHGQTHGICISHFHSDHVLGLVAMKWGKGCPVDIFYPQGSNDYADLLQEPGPFEF
jgi:alpha-D-ribose 1-methylphosphonate 5-triphosphate synthase subunit PhnI